MNYHRILPAYPTNYKRLSQDFYTSQEGKANYWIGGLCLRQLFTKKVIDSKSESFFEGYACPWSNFNVIMTYEGYSCVFCSMLLMSNDHCHYILNDMFMGNGGQENDATVSQQQNRSQTGYE